MYQSIAASCVPRRACFTKSEGKGDLKAHFFLLQIKPKGQLGEQQLKKNQYFDNQSVFEFVFLLIFL
jgi:hypothetical protein